MSAEVHSFYGRVLPEKLLWRVNSDWKAELLKMKGCIEMWNEMSI